MCRLVSIRLVADERGVVLWLQNLHSNVRVRSSRQYIAN